MRGLIVFILLVLFLGFGVLNSKPDPVVYVDDQVTMVQQIRMYDRITSLTNEDCEWVDNVHICALGDFQFLAYEGGRWDWYENINLRDQEHKSAEAFMNGEDHTLLLSYQVTK